MRCDGPPENAALAFGKSRRECLAVIAEARKTNLAPAEKDRAREWLASLIEARLTERFQFAETRAADTHGFALMALACLLMETVESYWLGIPDTVNKYGREFMITAHGAREVVTTSRVFNSFLQRRVNGAFRELVFDTVGYNSGDTFYHSIRCGLLHQGETTNGWRIRRSEEGGRAFDKHARVVYAEKFYFQVVESINELVAHLRNEPLESQSWANALRKLDSSCDACLAPK